jgi:hypothetical protein
MAGVGAAALEPLAASAKPREKKPAKAAATVPAGEANFPVETPLRVPPILLEDDAKGIFAIPALGQKFVLGPNPSAGQPESHGQELPEAYGTGKFVLTARDPHWLYAHWDLTREQQRRHNARSIHHHLIVRVHSGEVTSQPVAEIHVHPESQHWFVHVEQAGTAYRAELGYYQSHQKWVAVAASPVAVTPPETVSGDKTVEFATIRPEVPLSQIGAGAEEETPEAVQGWAPGPEPALADVFSAAEPGQGQIGSAEIAALIGGRMQSEWAGSAPEDFEFAAAGEQVGGMSSPQGGEESSPFWFNLNAELIIYGGTEPNANVTLDGRPIRLRPDGTFSCRFALPDGEYELAVAAMSEQGDLRQARLRFTRRTERQGEVGVQPSEAGLGEMTNDE